MAAKDGIHKMMVDYEYLQEYPLKVNLCLKDTMKVKERLYEFAKPWSTYNNPMRVIDNKKHRSEVNLSFT